MKSVPVAVVASVVLAAVGVVSPVAAQHDHHQQAGAAAPPPPLTLSFGPAQAGAGQDVDVPILVKGASGIGPMEMVLTYDPNILVAAEEKCAGKGPLLTNCQLESRSDPSGKMAITWASSDAVNGDGVLVTAHFRVKGQPGQKSPLGLEKVRAWGRDHPHMDALVTVVPGEFTVSPAGWPLWLLAVLGALAVLLVISLVLAARRRRTESPLAGAPVAAPVHGPSFPCPNPHCGRSVRQGSAFCPHCGQKTT